MDGRALASAERLVWLTRVSAVGIAWPTVAVAVVSFGGFVALGIAAARGDVPWALSIPLQAALAFAGFTPVHDASHRSIARGRWINELIGWLCGLPILAPFSGFRYIHYAHHAHTNDRDRDPDMWSSKARTRLGIVLRWTVMDLHYLARYATELRTRPRAEAAAGLAGVAAMWTSWAVLIATGHGVALVIAWLVPARIAILTLSIVFDWIPHYPRATTAAQDPYRATNVYEHRWLTAPLLAQNYHLIHHLYPGVPFYRYGRVYWEMRDELLARGADVRRIGVRVSMPRAAAAADELAIREVIEETPDTRTFVLDGHRPYVAGQFVVVEVPLPEGAVRRCYSLSRCPEAGELAITVRRQGRASSWLHAHASAGTRLGVSAAAGRFVLVPGSTRPLALLAAGSGITPVIAIAEHALRSTRRRVMLIYATRDRAHATFAARLAELRRVHPDRFDLVMHHDAVGGRFLDAATLARLLEPDVDLYACGPDGFMAMVDAAADEVGIPGAQRHAERFTPRHAGGDQPRATSFTAILGSLRHAVAVRPNETLLAAARRAGLEPRASCTNGYCGTCTAQLVCGRVASSATGPLGDGDLARGFILPCSTEALAAAPVVVDFDAVP